MGVLAHVGLGANLGDTRAALLGAIGELGRLRATRLLGVSSFYCSAPVDAHGPDYLNAVAALDSALEPLELLAELHRLEAAQGRERPYRNAPRVLDLDLLVYGDLRCATPTLTVPHPRLAERAFVLRPLAEIAPGLVVPGLGPVTDLLAGVAGQRLDRL